MKKIHRIHLIIQQFKTAKEASMGLASCLTAAFIISLMGCSLDISRYFLADHQLNQTIKATALAAVKEINPRKRQALLSAYEASNWGSNLYNLKLSPLVVKYGEEERLLTLQQSAVLPTYFLKAFNLKKMKINTAVSAHRISNYTEVAIAIDTSRFMGRDTSGSIDSSSQPYGTPIQQSKQIAQQLINRIFDGEESLPTMRVSIVPYSGTVNIGPENTAWTEGLENMDYGDAGWKGCVMARHSNCKDLTDHPAHSHPFTPFLWPSTYGKIFPIKENGQWVPAIEKHPRSGKLYLAMGDNNWQAEQSCEDDYSTNKRKLQGPNMSCPPPIFPLSNKRLKISNYLENINAYSRGSALDSLGLIWAERALSPEWQDLWNLGNKNPTPCPYCQLHSRKTIILIAHGNNTFDTWEGKFYDLHSAAAYQEYLGTKLTWEISHLSQDEQLELAAYPAPTIEEIIEESNISGVKMGTPIAGPFTAYGHLQDGNLNSIDPEEAQEEINKKFLKTCNWLNKQGVHIQIITLDPKIDKGTEDIYQRCASKPEYYHNTISQAEIKEMAKEIVDTNLLHVRVLG